MLYYEYLNTEGIGLNPRLNRVHLRGKNPVIEKSPLKSSLKVIVILDLLYENWIALLSWLGRVKPSFSPFSLSIPQQPASLYLFFN